MVAPGASWIPIGELSRRLGVSADVLRKWERRYGILKPGRTLGTAMAIQRAVTDCWKEPLEDDGTVVVMAVD